MKFPKIKMKSTSNDLKTLEVNTQNTELRKFISMYFLRVYNRSNLTIFVQKSWYFYQNDKRDHEKSVSFWFSWYFQMHSTSPYHNKSGRGRAHWNLLFWMFLKINYFNLILIWDGYFWKFITLKDPKYSDYNR